MLDSGATSSALEVFTNVVFTASFFFVVYFLYGRRRIYRFTVGDRTGALATGLTTANKARQLCENGEFRATDQPIVFQIFANELKFYSRRAGKIRTASVALDDFHDWRFKNSGLATWYVGRHTSPWRSSPIEFLKDGKRFDLLLWRWETDLRFLGYLNVWHESELIRGVTAKARKK